MLLSVIGTRPQYVKLSCIEDFCSSHNIAHEYIDTGQHYDFKLSQIFINEFGLKSPLLRLSLDNQSVVSQLSSGMIQLESFLSGKKVNSIIVYGDTTSTLIGALVARKLGLNLAHVEAGVRSFNFMQPEETNRTIVDCISHLLFAPTKSALKNLELENCKGRKLLSGDLSVPIISKWREENIKSLERTSISLPLGEYMIVTLHRPHNIDSQNKLEQILLSLRSVPFDLILLTHPRLRKKLIEYRLDLPRNIKIGDPVSHKELLNLLINSKGVITDSGTIQKEAYLLKVMCTTLGDSTEWPETTINGWNNLFNYDSAADLDSVVLRKTPEVYDPSIFGSTNSPQIIVEEALKM